ncbi:glycosyltransferase family 25 protein [Solemya velesiana gill symbiont]|uniref:Glycosyl transferase family 25 domain-containing protein n=1 Tax=Solemya velesiana gill symbiont TaxID=1918948 RepID=A0A1T2KW48_9GAMM|nr:glycosyltransferase family 25 protein [Solemya velesiana gill symbiont]OOZ37042.1 hypothetical protein BOW51_04325 [Solemya velesiana gill symbiont]
MSLADEAQRRSQIKQQFDDLGIDFEFIDSVDGRKKLDEEYERQIDREASLLKLKRYMHDSEFATTLSHLKAYHRVVEAGYSGAIIIEDDAILTARFKEIQASLRPRERFWDIQVPKIDSAFDNLLLPRTSFGFQPSMAVSVRKAAVCTVPFTRFLS